MRVSCQLVNRRHTVWMLGQEVPKVQVAEGFCRRWRVWERNKVNVRRGAFTWLMDFWEPEHLELKLKLPLGAGVNKCKWKVQMDYVIQKLHPSVGFLRDSPVLHQKTHFITLYVQLVSLVVETLFKIFGRKRQHRRKMLVNPRGMKRNYIFNI